MLFCCRVNADGSLTVLNSGDRILLTNNQFLTISNIVPSDAAPYQCTATNPAGVAIAMAQLVVFSQSNVIIMPLTGFSTTVSRRNRRSVFEQQCHHFNATQFEV